MTELSMGENSINGNGEERDGLRRIRGIGPTKRQWLEGLGICTVEDLARGSTDEIESRLRAEGHPVSRPEIEGWIAQAQEFASNLSSQPSAQSLEAADEQSPNYPLEESELPQPVEELAKGDIEENLSLLEEEGKWRTFASFEVEFQSRQVEGRTELQTRGRHIETERVRTWSGIESTPLQQWVLEQMNEKMQPETETEPPVATIPVKVEIIQLQIVQPPHDGIPIVAHQAGQGFPSFIQHGEPFALEVVFRLAGLKAVDVTKAGITYCIQVYARHRATGAIALLGDIETHLLVQEQPFYTTWMPETSLQQSGMYRLQVLLTFQGTSIPPAFFEVPLLQVV